MTAAWQVVYTSSSPYAYLFASAEIDLTNMVALDVIDIRARKIIVAGGAWVVASQLSYTGVQPVNHKTVRIGPFLDVNGVEISMRQTVGALVNIDCEFMDARR